MTSPLDHLSGGTGVSHWIHPYDKVVDRRVSIGYARQHEEEAPAIDRRFPGRVHFGAADRRRADAADAGGDEGEL